MTVPCETRPTPERCNCLPPLDDWKDGHPDAWDYDAVLCDNSVVVEWCDTLVDGNGNEHRAGKFAGWGFYWKHGAIHIGRCSEQIARKAAALFVSLWLRGVSASFCDKIMLGMIWFWELQESVPSKRISTLIVAGQRIHGRASKGSRFFAS